MAKCSFKNCDIETDILLYHIDNGKEKIVLCPNHSVLFAINEAEEITKYPSELPEDTDLHCEICGKEGYEFKEHEYTLKLCIDHIRKLLKRNLSPEEFFSLYKKYPEMFLLHDDFYDPVTGEAIQPVEIE
jgi:hypothetical protein